MDLNGLQELLQQQVSGMEGLSLLKENVLVNKLVASFLVFMLVIGIRGIIVRKLSESEELEPTLRRRWVVIIRNTALMTFIVFLIIIWLDQIRTLAASLIVIAAAIVVATKEFILNIIGYLYRSSAKFISVGDRIQIGEIRGDVIDQTLTGITLMEIGPGTKTHQYTGLTVFIPNASFLSQPVKNETHMWGGDYVFHIINIPIKVDANWQDAEKCLLKSANEVCSPFIDQAKKNMLRLAHKYSLEAPSVEPRIHIQITDPEKASLVLRVPVPSRHRGRLEQDISRKYLINLQKERDLKGIQEKVVSEVPQQQALNS